MKTICSPTTHHVESLTMLVQISRFALRLAGVIMVALISLSARAHETEAQQTNVISPLLATTKGTVAELQVNNRLTGVTLRYFALKADQGGSYALTGAGLDSLSNGLRIDATGLLTGNV